MNAPYADKESSLTVGYEVAVALVMGRRPSLDVEYVREMGNGKVWVFDASTWTYWKVKIPCSMRGSNF
jgi:hypothetical protein